MISENLNNFNSTVIDLAEQLSLICPNSIISNNINLIKSVIKNKPTKIIELFIIYVLPDKSKIDKGDDDFFLNKSYNDEVEKHSISINKVFEFKNIWNKISIENQEVVKQYMQCLCYYSQEYFLEKY